MEAFKQTKTIKLGKTSQLPWDLPPGGVGNHNRYTHLLFLPIKVPKQAVVETPFFNPICYEVRSSKSRELRNFEIENKIWSNRKICVIFFRPIFKKSQYFWRGLKFSILLVPKSSQYMFRKSQPISGYAIHRIRRKSRIPKGLVESPPVGNRVKCQRRYIK